MAAHNESTEDKKNHNIMTWLRNTENSRSRLIESTLALLIMVLRDCIVIDYNCFHVQGFGTFRNVKYIVKIVLHDSAITLFAHNLNTRVQYIENGSCNIFMHKHE